MMDRISMCEALAKRNEIDPFRKRMVTGDEEWVTYYNIVRKRSWSKCGEAAQTVGKPGLTARKIVRVQYFVRGGFVRHRSRASSKHLSSHLPVDGARFLGGQKGVALQVQDARVGVGSTKKPTPLDVDVRRSDVTALALSYRTFPLRKV
ncbi:uncharacterized protein TNCV_3754411 [Trichonephila clavipes]|nr:uncharacterized protein TNCV_3754411 [Trichonephila clavipes]